ncbi:MAG: methyltransferase domain-containing protein [Armatimonadetes bacterium]|nr:methyltransferase domain-containing protein [Armatimonadota bacterium]
MNEDPIIQSIKRDIEELLAAKRAIKGTGFDEKLTDANPGEENVPEEIHWFLAEAKGQAQVDINHVPVRSVRPLWGPLITLFKRIVRKSTYWLYQPLFTRISAFHNVLLDFLDKIVLHVRDIKNDLDRQLDELHVDNRNLNEESLVSLRTYLDQKLENALEQLSSRFEERIKEVNVCLAQDKAEFQRGLGEVREHVQGMKAGLEERIKEVAISFAVDKTELRRELAAMRQNALDVLREFEDLRRMVENYRAETAFLQAKLALAVQYQKTGKLPVKESGYSVTGENDALFGALTGSAWLYYSFEQQFRGTEQMIRERQRIYLPYAQKAQAACGGYVLDLGSGRGEFLELCREAGVPAKGVDLSEVMVTRCREKGLTVEEGDALTYLQHLSDESLCAITAFQLVEHLSPDRLWQLIQTALVKLKAGGVVILETVNPDSLVAFKNFYLDLTHQKPIPVATLRFLLEAAGFREIEVLFSSPVTDSSRLQGDDPNTQKLNELLFGNQDYALVGWR